MHEHVEEGEQSDHTAKTGQPVPATYLPQRRNRQHYENKTQTPIAESILNILDRIRTEITGDTICVSPTTRAQGINAVTKINGFQMKRIWRITSMSGRASN